MFYGILIEEATNIKKMPGNFELKKVYDDSKKISKVDKFTIMFQEECDYKQEIENIKYMIKQDNWENEINSIIEDEVPDIVKGAKDKAYFVEYWLEDEITYYIVFKCNNKDHKAYNKNVVIKLKRLESVKSLNIY